MHYNIEKLKIFLKTDKLQTLDPLRNKNVNVELFLKVLQIRTKEHSTPIDHKKEVKIQFV